MPDPIFADPRLAALYDIVDDDRRDLDAYAAIVEELRASSVLDLGCGTGTLACRLVFETRDPARRAWEGWTRDHTHRVLHVPGVGRVETWTDLVEVQQPLVSFRHVFRFAGDGTEVVSDSTLRFRSRDEISESLDAAGFQLRAIRDAPDRPGLELVFLARREVERRPMSGAERGGERADMAPCAGR